KSAAAVGSRPISVWGKTTPTFIVCPSWEASRMGSPAHGFDATKRIPWPRASIGCGSPSDEWFVCVRAKSGGMIVCANFSASWMKARGIPSAHPSCGVLEAGGESCGAGLLGLTITDLIASHSIGAAMAAAQQASGRPLGAEPAFQYAATSLRITILGPPLIRAALTLRGRVRALQAEHVTVICSLFTGE